MTVILYIHLYSSRHSRSIYIYSSRNRSIYSRRHAHIQRHNSYIQQSLDRSIYIVVDILDRSWLVVSMVIWPATYILASHNIDQTPHSCSCLHPPTFLYQFERRRRVGNLNKELSNRSLVEQLGYWSKREIRGWGLPKLNSFVSLASPSPSHSIDGCLEIEPAWVPLSFSRQPDFAYSFPSHLFVSQLIQLIPNRNRTEPLLLSEYCSQYEQLLGFELAIKSPTLAEPYQWH